MWMHLRHIFMMGFFQQLNISLKVFFSKEDIFCMYLYGVLSLLFWCTYTVHIYWYKKFRMHDSGYILHTYTQNINIVIYISKLEDMRILVMHVFLFLKICQNQPSVTGVSYAELELKNIQFFRNFLKENYVMVYISRATKTIRPTLACKCRNSMQKPNFACQKSADS